METKTYTHRHLKYYEHDSIGMTKYKVMTLHETDNPYKLITMLKELYDISEWWVEETTSVVKRYTSAEIEGRYATGGVCVRQDCGHSRSSHNSGENSRFGTSCFHKNGHDIYCDCQAFIKTRDAQMYDAGHSD